MERLQMRKASSDKPGISSQTVYQKGIGNFQGSLSSVNLVLKQQKDPSKIHNGLYRIERNGPQKPSHIKNNSISGGSFKKTFSNLKISEKPQLKMGQSRGNCSWIHRASSKKKAPSKDFLNKKGSTPNLAEFQSQNFRGEANHQKETEKTLGSEERRRNFENPEQFSVEQSRDGNMSVEYSREFGRSMNRFHLNNSHFAGGGPFYKGLGAQGSGEMEEETRINLEKDDKSHPMENFKKKMSKIFEERHQGAEFEGQKQGVIFGKTKQKMGLVNRSALRKKTAKKVKDQNKTMSGFIYGGKAGSQAKLGMNGDVYAKNQGNMGEEAERIDLYKMMKGEGKNAGLQMVQGDKPETLNHYLKISNDQKAGTSSNFKVGKKKTEQIDSVEPSEKNFNEVLDRSLHEKFGGPLGQKSSGYGIGEPENGGSLKKQSFQITTKTTKRRTGSQEPMNGALNSPNQQIDKLVNHFSQERPGFGPFQEGSGLASPDKLQKTEDEIDMEMLGGLNKETEAEGGKDLNGKKGLNKSMACVAEYKKGEVRKDEKNDESKNEIEPAIESPKTAELGANQQKNPSSFSHSRARSLEMKEVTRIVPPERKEMAMMNKPEQEQCKPALIIKSEKPKVKTPLLLSTTAQKEQARLISEIETVHTNTKRYPQTTIDFYDISKVLGKGSFGEVSLATQKLTGYQVAIKVFDKSMLKSDYKKQKIVQEVNIMKKILHNNTIRLLEVFEDTCSVYLVMEWAEKGDLLHIMKRQNNRIPEFQAQKYFRQILDAVEWLHSQRILHRDLKLDNILIATKNEVKVCDFGISKVMNENDIVKEKCGTPAYNSPEIIVNRGYSGFQSDIWSLGVLLYAMCSARVPFFADTVDELYKIVLKGEYDMPREFSPSLADLISKMLVLDPEKRIRLEEIKKHRWVSSGYIPLAHKESESKESCVKTMELKPNLVSIVESFGFSKSYIEKSVSNNVMNHAYACYFTVYHSQK